MYKPAPEPTEIAKTEGLNKKDAELDFNELFHITVTDPENEVISVRFVHGHRMCDSNERAFIGEISFPLRGRPSQN
jgi:hypothetical protein